MATAEHESFFSPRMVHEAEFQAEANNYEGGVLYAGRGYIQLTGEENYREIGEHLGLDLTENPDMALEAETSAKILAAFFKMKGTAELAKKGEFLDARRTVNGGEFESEDARIKNTPRVVAERAATYRASMR